MLIVPSGSISEWSHIATEDHINQCTYIIGRCPSRRVDQRHNIIQHLLRIPLHRLPHIRKWRLPLERIAKITMRAHDAKPSAAIPDFPVQRLADLVCEEGRRGYGRRETSCDVL